MCDINFYSFLCVCRIVSDAAYNAVNQTFPWDNMPYKILNAQRSVNIMMTTVFCTVPHGYYLIDYLFDVRNSLGCRGR